MRDRGAEFDDFVAATASRLLRIAFALTGDRSAAEDLVQDALERLYVAWPRVDDPGAYAHQSLINRSHNRWRQRARHPESGLGAHHDPIAPDDTQRSDDHDLVVRAISTLPPRQRAVIVLRFLDDLSEVDTAAAMSCSVGTVKSQTSRALAQLRKVLATDGETTPGKERNVILDDSTISDALHAATDPITAPADLAASARRGGSRRLRVRRIGAVIATVATVGVIVSGAIALASETSGRGPLQPAGGPSALPPARSCDDSGGGPASPASYPQLLMLPPDQPVTYAFTNTGSAPRCGYFPHIALTLLHEHAGAVSRGVEVDGPDAQNAVQAGRAGPGLQFNGTTLHPRVDGRPATVYYIAAVRSADVFWSGPGADQWHASTRGLQPAAIVRLLSRLRFDPQTGDATLPDAAARGWTVAPVAPDSAGPQLGVFYALWHESGSKVAMWLAPGPNRIDQDAVSGGRLVTVGGRPAIVSGHGDIVMQWQVRKDVTAYLAMTHSTPALIQQVAATLVPISPSDPRLHRPG